ncbi:MAG: molybdopterin-binding protein [Tildeniella nuda ZEHNDER 1965/U140]|jgi:molybdopterin-binding protein|nr:molybdopterin-binding protein [Tildeniella nuda ZEHNDER 1965/U140]
MPRKEQGWITFQSSEDERALLEQYCQESQRTKTEILRELIRSLDPKPQASLPGQPEASDVFSAPIELVSPQPISPKKPIKVSSRNLLKGRIKRIVMGSVNSEIILEIVQPIALVSIITKVSVEELELAEGQEAYAVIKSSDVAIARE